MRHWLVRLLLLSLITVTSLSWSFAQNCGQRDTIIFTANSTASLSLTLSDYFNDDLSDPEQGLCGIELGFVHQFVENFELSLTSPAGQTVNLLGPNSDDPFAFTPGTQWQISLVNCASVAEPDSAFTAQWNNEQTENWVPFDSYTGSYYPFGGCLEDFNTGPVNGTWTFNITNDPSNNPGAITYVRLIFCDSRGVECCFAQAGLLQNEDILSCVGEDTLLITPDLSFPLGVADTSEYSYAYLISLDGTYQQLDSVLDLRAAPAGEYDICGFSYRSSQLDSLPLPDGMLTMDSIRSNLEGLEPWLCGVLTPECLHVSIVAPPDTTRLNERICRGDSVVVGAQSFEDSGFFTVDLMNYAGCDSIVTLDLFVQEVQFTTIDTTICPGDTVFIGTEFYFETGSYQDTLPTVELGCDSVVNLNLIVLAEQVTPLTPVICSGESFAVGDSLLTETGNYQILLTSINGCDSLVNVDLLVLAPEAQTSGPSLISCLLPEALLSSVNSLPDGELSFRWLDTDESLLATTATYVATASGDYILEVSQEVPPTICVDRDTFSLLSNFDSPIADAGLMDSITCANPSLQIGGLNTSTGGIYIYQWQSSNGNITGPLTSLFTTVDSPGDYQLVVQDIVSLCTDTSTVTITSNEAPPTVDMGPPFTLNCLVAADTLDGSASLGPGITATWSGPCITETPGPGLAIIDCPGWYYLDVFNSNNGCSNTDSLLIEEDVVPPLAIIAPPDTLNCIQDIVNLEASASSPVGQLDFVWAGPSGQSGTAENLMATEAGNYQLIVIDQDNFCRDTTSVMVMQDTLIPFADAGADSTLNCYTEELVLQGENTSLGPEYSYQWYTSGSLIIGAQDDSLLITEAGSFILEVTDLRNGCSARDTTEISEDFQPPEDVVAGPNQLLDCGGSLVQLQPDSTIFSRPVNWEWTADCIAPQSDSWAIFTDCPGLYTLTVTNIDNGCQGSDTTRVNIAPNFSIAILPDTAYLSCTTGTTILDNDGSIGSIFRWFRDGIEISLPNNQPSVNQAGTYTLITGDINQTCTDTASIEVVIDCNFEAIIDPPNPLTCANQSIILEGSNSIVEGPYSYAWTGPQAGCLLSPPDSPTIEVVCPGDYQLIIEHDLFGLLDTAIVTVVIDTITPMIDAGPNQQITCAAETASLQGMIVGNINDYTYAWTPFFSPGDTLIQNINYSTDVPGTYLLQAQDINNGCISTDVVQVLLNNNDPVIAFGSSVFPCEADTFRLQAFINPAGDDYTYSWSGPGIQADADSLGVLINQIGVYSLTVLNNETGCSATDMVEVTEQTCIPCLELAPVDTLDCLTFSVEITADFCRSCEECTLQWSDSNGDLPGEESLILTVNNPGEYILTATDTLGFSSMVTAEVILSNDLPLVDLGPDRVITCDSTSFLLLNLAANPAGEYAYRWEELSMGDLPENGPELMVSAAGEYVLELTNLQTGCSSSDTLMISMDNLPPVAEAGPDQELTCQNSAIVLDGTGSTLSGVTYLWTGPNTACLSGEDTNTPLVNCAGLYTLVVTNSINGCTATDTVRVTINEEVPELIALPDTVLTCNQSSLVLTASPPSNGTFTTRWCPLNELGEEITIQCIPDVNDFTVDTPGQYQYTVINDATNCSNSFIVTVSMDTLPPMVDAGLEDTLFCNLNSLVLQGTAAPNDSYLWSSPTATQIDNATTLQPTIYEAGWYYLDVQSFANGCTARDSVLIAEDENQPDLMIGNDTLINCFQAEVQLTASGTTFNGPASWLWDGPAGGLLADEDTPTPLVGAAGWYFVTLTDSGNGCSISDSLLVTGDFVPPQAIVDDFENLLLNCAQDTLLLNGANSISNTGMGLTYNWQATPPGTLFPDVAAPQIFTDRPGNYQLIVSDTGNGCRDTLNFDVAGDFTLPSLSLLPAAPISCGEETSLLVPSIPTSPEGYTFAWTDENNTLISTEFTATATSSGWYYLLLTDEENGCSRLDSVFVDNAMDIPVVVLGTNGNISCSQSTVQLDGSGSSVGNNYVYQWSSSTGTVLGNGDELLDSTSIAGTYTLMITDTFSGCSNSDSVTVLLQGSPISGLTIDVEQPPCNGDLIGSISIDDVQGGTPPYSYQLNDQAAGNLSFFEDLLPATYYLQVVDSEGCEWRDTVLITEPSPLELELGPDVEIQLGDSIQLDPLTNRPISAWKWNAPTLLTDDAPYRPFVSPLESQFVLLSVTDENGCTATDTLRILVDKLRQVFIPTAFAPGRNNGMFTIYAGQEVVEIESLRIFSRWGNMVFEQENFAPNDPNLGWDGTLWGEPLNSAVFVYYAQIRFTDGKTELITGDVVLMK